MSPTSQTGYIYKRKYILLPGYALTKVAVDLR
jgi:hypothetical protein